MSHTFASESAKFLVPSVLALLTGGRSLVPRKVDSKRLQILRFDASTGCCLLSDTQSKVQAVLDASVVLSLSKALPEDDIRGTHVAVVNGRFCCLPIPGVAGQYQVIIHVMEMEMRGCIGCNPIGYPIWLHEAKQVKEALRSLSSMEIAERLPAADWCRERMYPKYCFGPAFTIADATPLASAIPPSALVAPEQQMVPAASALGDCAEHDESFYSDNFNLGVMEEYSTEASSDSDESDDKPLKGTVDSLAQQTMPEYMPSLAADEAPMAAEPEKLPEPHFSSLGSHIPATLPNSTASNSASTPVADNASIRDTPVLTGQSSSQKSTPNRLSAVSQTHKASPPLSAAPLSSPKPAAKLLTAALQSPKTHNLPSSPAPLSSPKPATKQRTAALQSPKTANLPPSPAPLSSQKPATKKSPARLQSPTAGPPPDAAKSLGSSAKPAKVTTSKSTKRSRPKSEADSVSASVRHVRARRDGDVDNWKSMFSIFDMLIKFPE